MLNASKVASAMVQPTGTAAYRAWAHDYRSDLPRFVSEVYCPPASPEQLGRIEAARPLRETVRERLLSADVLPPADLVRSGSRVACR